MRPMKAYPYQMMYKTTVDELEMMPETTVDGRDQWTITHTRWSKKQQLMDETIRKPYQMKYEAIVDGWDQRTTTHARRWTKMLMDETDEGIHAR